MRDNKPALQRFDYIYKILSHSTTNLIICLSPHFDILDINPAAEDIFGIPKKEIIGQNLFIFCSKNGFDFPLSTNVFKISVSEILHDIRCDIKNSKGMNYSINWTISNLIDQQNHASGFLLIGKHLQQDRQSKANVLISDKDEEIAILKNVIAKLPGHLYWKDQNGVYLGSNDGNIKFAGLFSQKDIIGKTDYEMPWRKQATEFEKVDREVMETGKTIEREERGISHDGTMLIGLSQKTPLRDKTGRIIGIIGNSIDITKLKKTQLALKRAKEKAQLANEAKTEFIMNISHDIRTPFSGVLGVAQYLLSHETGKEKKEQLGYIVKSAEQLLSLLNEIIDLTKIESGKLPVNSSMLTVRKLIDDVKATTLASIKQKGLELIIHITENVPDVILSDETRLRRILLNLIGNSIKFTENGQITIAIEPRENAEDKNRIDLRFIVEDTGIGIPKDRLDSIFDKFSRVSSAYTGKYKGTGLGLHIVKKFVKELKGKIVVVSKLGSGTKFILTIPFDLPLADEVKKVTSKKQVGVTMRVRKTDIHRPLHILVIEDDSIAQFVAQKIMNELGHQIEIADSAGKALQYLKTTTFDLIITDIGLPDIDGVALVKKIRKELKLTMPIIALTAHVAKEDEKKCLQAGIDEVLTKPISKEQIEIAISNYFNYKE